MFGSHRWHQDTGPAIRDRRGEAPDPHRLYPIRWIADLKGAGSFSN
jgi:hypothetical protein